MDPAAMLNEGSFANGSANTAPYHLGEIWQFPPPVNGGLAGLGESGGDGLGLRRPQFRLGQFENFTTTGSNRDVSGNDPINSEQREAKHGSGVQNRKRGDSEHESNDRDGKRLKTSGKKNESCDAKAETEPNSSGKPAEQTTQPPPDPPKQDYIHVRARRGQATDSHSLAERARREKISERMKILQDLVPGCNKVIGKALVLDEIINYIQSLQRQVEFLSMKLEAVNSRLNHDIEVFPPKDHFDQQTFDTMGMPFVSQAAREYSRGSSPEWLHMQIGGGFERTS